MLSPNLNIYALARSLVLSRSSASSSSQLASPRWLHHRMYICGFHVQYTYETKIATLSDALGVNNLICTQIVELIDRYDAECVSANDKVGFIQDTKTDKACTRKITVSIWHGNMGLYMQLDTFIRWPGSISFSVDVSEHVFR